MLFRTAVALMDLYGPVVTTKDAGNAITLLQTLADSTFDSSQLVLTACMDFLTVTEDTLQELREKHRPAMLSAVEERTKGGRINLFSNSFPYINYQQHRCIFTCNARVFP